MIGIAWYITHLGEGRAYLNVAPHIKQVSLATVVLVSQDIRPSRVERYAILSIAYDYSRLSIGRCQSDVGNS